MGDWYLQPDPNDPDGFGGRWVHDPAAPTPGYNPAVTMIQNQITPAEIERREITAAEIEQREVGRVLDMDALHGNEDDHDVEPVDPDELPSYDGVESKLIRPLGAPD